MTVSTVSPVVRSHVLSVLPDAVLLLDAELRVVDHNGVAHRWLGLPPDADITTDAVHPDDRPVLVSAQAEVVVSPPGWSVPVPVRVQHADGGWHTWSVRANNQLRGEVGAVVVVARDTTGRLGLSTGQADAVLRELISGAPVATIALDRSGRVRFAGGKGLAFDPSSFAGKPLAELFESDEHHVLLRRALAGERVDEVTEWAGGWWHVRYAPLTRDGVSDGAVGVFLDITERTLAARALSASEAHLRAVLQAVREPLVVLDADRVITMANPRFRSVFGPKGAPGHALGEAVGAEAAEAVAAAARRTTGRPDARVEVRVHDRNGAPVWVLVSADAVHDEQGRTAGSVVVLTDITAHKDAERRLAVAARTDPVTGAANRATLADRLDQALARRDACVGVLFCDVDGLKAVNDAHGHGAGDRLLREVAGRIRSALRPSDSLVRYGGDEFVVVCDALPDRDEAAALAERVRAAVARPLHLDGAVVVPTLSIGVATAPPRTGAAEVLAAADTAVYAAKSAGRDTVRVDP